MAAYSRPKRAAVTLAPLKSFNIATIVWQHTAYRRVAAMSVGVRSSRNSWTASSHISWKASHSVKSNVCARMIRQGLPSCQGLFTKARQAAKKYSIMLGSSNRHSQGMSASIAICIPKACLQVSRYAFPRHICKYRDMHSQGISASMPMCSW
jgi:hypothetical protein